MSRQRQLLCLCYALIAVGALYGTWSQNLFYFNDLSPRNTIAAFGTFVLDTRVNAAARSITIDILLFLLPAAIWMVFEARRLGLRWVWAYIVLAFGTAISVTFPLFLIAREVRLAREPGAAAGGQPTTGDYLGLVALSAFVVWLCWFIAVG